MPIIEWSDSYAIGNEQIDDQHKKIFTIFNRLYDSFIDDSGGKVYERAVDRLLSISNHHFLLEESIMFESGNSEYYEHLREHKFFTRKVGELQDMVITGQKEQTRELMEYLGNWIIHHEIVRDRKISD